jgi:phenolic acid decarboxylase
VSISTPDKVTYDIKMLDILGKTVYHHSIGLDNETKLIQIPIQSLSSGIYTIKVSDTQGSEVIKFIKNSN